MTSRLAFQPPSVLFVDQSAELGGAELSLFDFVTRREGESLVCLLDAGPFVSKLGERGIKVDVIALNAAGALRRTGGVLDIMASAPAVWAALFALARRARAFDVVYANTMKAFVLAALARPLHRRPIVWHLHDLLTPEHVSAPLRLVAIVLAWLFARRVIANSHATAAAFAHQGGPSRRVAIIYNGIDDAPFQAIDTTRARRALCEETGLSPDRPVVGVFSRLAGWKGQHVLLEVLRDNPTLQAIVVGGPLFGEEAYGERLLELVGRYGLGDRVRMLGFRSDVPALMRGVDIVLHTSTSAEPFGRVIAEGMLAEKPVVATRAGGAVELVEDGVTGLLATPGDRIALATAIQRLVADPATSARLAATGRAHARTAFDLDILSDRIEAVIRSAAA